MKEFNYHDTAKQIGWNFSNIKNKVEYKHDYNYYRKVVENITPQTVMLDIGCGSGEKSIRYYSLAKKVVMLDIENEMLKKAKANREKYYGSKYNSKFNFILADGDGKLDFKDESFDLVVSRHCGANMREVYRILKKGGIFISEDIDDKDCIALKECFNRGQAYGNKEDLKVTILNECVKAGFSTIELKNMEEIEYYPEIEGLEYLLGYTPIINGYDEVNDRKTLEKYCEQNATKKGVKLVRKLFAFYLVK